MVILLQFLGVACLVILHTNLSAQADWSARFEVTTQIPRANTQPQSTKVSGSVQAKEFRQRIELGGASPMVGIIDLKAGKAWSLMPASKLAVETSLSGLRSQIPQCDTRDVDQCLQRLGFKRTGREAISGEPCDIFETSQTWMGKRTTTRLWRPTRLGEVPALRTISTSPDGASTELRLSEVKIGFVPNARFEIPEGYRRSSNLGDLFQGFKLQLRKPESH